MLDIVEKCITDNYPLCTVITISLVYSQHPFLLVDVCSILIVKDFKD